MVLNQEREKYFTSHWYYKQYEISVPIVHRSSGPLNGIVFLICCYFLCHVGMYNPVYWRTFWFSTPPPPFDSAQTASENSLGTTEKRIWFSDHPISRAAPISVFCPVALVHCMPCRCSADCSRCTSHSGNIPSIARCTRKQAKHDVLRYSYGYSM